MALNVKCLIFFVLLCLFQQHTIHSSETETNLLFEITARNTSTEYEFVEFFVGDEITLEFNITECPIEEVLVRASNDDVFEITGSDESEVIIARKGVPFQLTISGKFLGLETIEFVDDYINLAVGTFEVRVKRVLGLVNTLFTVVLLVWLVISYISMGALINWEEIKQRIFPPWRLIIGMVCQFFIMPAITFVIASILPIDDPTAIGIILVGTCPGGWLSNIFSVLLDVDFILSVTMTFFSSIFALFMMPFNIWLYISYFARDNARLATPFGDLALQLGILVIACGVGILLGWRFEKVRKFCEKVLKPVAAVLIICGLALGIPADFHMFSSPWQLWVAAAVAPLVGAYMGLSLSRVFGINLKSSVTVALETGVQNALLARTVVGYAYPQPEGDLIGRVQTLTVLITLIEGVVVCIIYVTVRCICCRNTLEDEEKLQKKEEVKKPFSISKNMPGTNPSRGGEEERVTKRKTETHDASDENSYTTASGSREESQGAVVNAAFDGSWA